MPPTLTTNQQIGVGFNYAAAGMLVILAAIKVWKRDECVMKDWDKWKVWLVILIMLAVGIVSILFNSTFLSDYMGEGFANILSKFGTQQHQGTIPGAIPLKDS